MITSQLLLGLVDNATVLQHDRRDAPKETQRKSYLFTVSSRVSIIRTVNLITKQ